MGAAPTDTRDPVARAKRLAVQASLDAIVARLDSLEARLADGEPFPDFEWAMVTTGGGPRLFGRISIEERFGLRMLRVDRPKLESGFESSMFVRLEMVQQIQPCTEETCRVHAQRGPEPARGNGR